MMKYLATFFLTVLIITSCTKKEKPDFPNTKGHENIALEGATLVDDEIIETPYGQVELQHNFLM